MIPIPFGLHLLSYKTPEIRVFHSGPPQGKPSQPVALHDVQLPGAAGGVFKPHSCKAPSAPPYLYIGT